MSATPDTLIIDTADLASLVAVALQRDAASFALWHPRGDDPTAERLAAMARRHAAVFGAEQFVVTDCVQAPCPVKDASEWWSHSALLLHGLGIAEALGCTRVVWPHQVGSNFDELGPIVDRTTLISGLCPGVGGDEAIVFDLPLLDLTDEQLVELADDSGADLAMHWPCAEDGETTCGECFGCQRWMTAFDQVGPAWPWETVLSAAGG